MLKLCLWWGNDFLKPIQGSDQGIYFRLKESLYTVWVKKKKNIHPLSCSTNRLAHSALFHYKFQKEDQTSTLQRENNTV